MRKGILRTAAKVVVSVFIIWIAILAILEIALSQAVLSKVVNRFATEYVDGDVRFDKVRVSMFRRFPSVCLTLEDFSLTYPADRFDEAEKNGAQGWLLHQGCGEQADTLASLERLSISIRPGALLFGKINVPHMDLVKPRIFAHNYGNGTANWDIFKFESSEEDDQSGSSFEIPSVSLGRINFKDHPHIVYTDSKDTLFALLNVKSIGIRGKINTKKVEKSRIGLGIDSLIAAGRMAEDTLAFGMESFKVYQIKSIIHSSKLFP